MVRHGWRDGVCGGGAVIVGRESELKVWTTARQRQCPGCYETGKRGRKGRLGERKGDDV